MPSSTTLLTNSRRDAAPSHRLAPDCVKTLGPRVRAFASEVGLNLQPWQALVVDDMLGVRADRRWAARDSGLAVPRQNGKSVVAELRILAGLYLFKEELIVYTAHQVDTALEIFERVVKRIEDNPDLKKRLVGRPRRARGSESITLREDPNRGLPQQRLLIKARSKGGVRGFSADTIFLDEAQLGLDESEMASLGPTMRTRPNPQTIFMGTPPLEPGTYWALKVRARALGGDPKMAWHEWSPQDKFDPADRDVWWATNPALAGGLITEEDIEYDLKTLGSKFIADGLGGWPKEKDDAGWEVLDEDDWTQAQDPGSEIEGSPAFAIEVSRDLSTVSIGAAGQNAEGLRHLELIAKFPADTGRIVGWLKKRREKWKPVAVLIDPSGPAGYLITEIEKHYGEVAKPLGRDVASACASVYVGISGKPAEPDDDDVDDDPDGEPAEDSDARDIRVRPHPALDSAARVAVWRDRGDARVFDRRLADGPDVAPLMAVTLADLAFRTAPAPEQQFFGSWR